jgi:hypothetical protein
MDICPRLKKSEHKEQISRFQHAAVHHQPAERTAGIGGRHGCPARVGKVKIPGRRDLFQRRNHLNEIAGRAPRKDSVTAQRAGTSRADSFQNPRELQNFQRLIPHP